MAAKTPKGKAITAVTKTVSNEPRIAVRTPARSGSGDCGETMNLGLIQETKSTSASGYFQVDAGQFIGFGAIAGQPYNAGDTRLYRDGIATLALRNGANAQTFRVYNTYDGLDDEWATIDWTTNVGYLTIGTKKTGSGAQRGTIFASADKIYFAPGGGVTSFRFENTGHFVTGTDGNYDIGASGANRPRTVYVADNVVTGATDFIHETSAALTDGAGANTATLTNAPSAGNPTKWIAINDNGTTRYIPTWE